VACGDQGAPESATVPATDAASQQTAESLIQKHLSALGGEARLKAASTMKFTAKSESGGEVDSFTAHRRRPNQFRILSPGS
jgi:hypothetical protein